MTETLSAQHALAIVEHCPFALLVMDINGRIISYNQAFERLVGRAQADDLQGQSIAEIGNHPARNLLGAEASVCWTDRNNTRHHFEIERIELPGKDFAQARLFIDISRQVELEQAQDTLNEELKQHTLTDPVTGLLNQRGVMLALEPQVARSRRYNSPMAVIMMNVQCQSDCDSVRLHVAQLLKDQLRWADLIGCNEQHEFMLILPETTPEAGLRLAAKLQQRLQEMVEQKLDGKLVDTCYGVTGWRRSDNADTLLKRARMALSSARFEHHNHPIAL
jgi:diguanylate cyclase (GGDEF)-like protein/PAS domain S-box-containing protein